MIEWYKTLSPKIKILIFSLVGILLLLIITLIILSSKNANPTNPLVPIFNPSPQNLSTQGPQNNNQIISNIPVSIQPITSIRTDPSPDPNSIKGVSIKFPSLYQNYIYYLSDDQTTFYKISLNGKDKQQISDYLQARIIRVSWSPDKKSAILTLVNNQYNLSKFNSPFYSAKDPDLALTNWYYDFMTKKVIQLDSKISSPIFLGNSNQIAYLKTDNGASKNKIYTASPDGSNEQAVISIPELRQDILIWVGHNQLLSYAAPEGYGRNYIYLSNLDNKTVGIINKNGLDYGAIVSLQVDKIITQNVDNSNPPDYIYKLNLIDLNTKQETPLGIAADINSTAWSMDGNIIFVLTPPSLLAVDIKSLTKKQIPLPADYSNLKIDNDNPLLVSPDNHSLFFTSNQLLYKIAY